MDLTKGKFAAVGLSPTAKLAAQSDTVAGYSDKSGDTKVGMLYSRVAVEDDGLPRFLGACNAGDIARVIKHFSHKPKKDK